jgi:hypothetical protein
VDVCVHSEEREEKFLEVVSQFRKELLQGSFEKGLHGLVFVMVVRNLWDAATKVEEAEGGRVENLGCLKGGGGGSGEGLSGPTGEE